MAKQTLNNGDSLLVIRTKINDNTTELYTATSDAQADADAALNGLTNKVDKEAGKGLSTNDYTTTEKNKLAAIAPSATANATDAQLRDRSTHTGTQLAATISDFGSTVLAAVLTGISFATFTAITATDSILSALGKLQAQITANGTAIGLKQDKNLTLNPQTGTAYTLDLTDNGKLVQMSNAAANTLTVPLNSTAAFPIGSQILIEQLGAGQVTFAPASGVTINQRQSYLKTAGQYALVSLIKKAADTWVLSGDLTV